MVSVFIKSIYKLIFQVTLVEMNVISQGSWGSVFEHQFVGRPTDNYTTKWRHRISHCAHTVLCKSNESIICQKFANFWAFW